MKTVHRRYLIEQAIAGFVINAVLNAGIAWLVFHSFETVPLWGEQSIMGDTIATGFLLPFLVCLVLTPLTRGQIRSGKLPADDVTRALVSRLPKGLFVRSLVVGAVGLPIAALPVFAILSGLGVTEIASAPFIGIKALIAGLLAALVSPPIALRALGDASGEVSANPAL